MHEYSYLIIGGGMAADSAVKGIRASDSSGTIGMISNEAHRPYARPPLSKALWKGEQTDSVWRNTPSANVDIHLSRTAAKVDTERKIVTDDQGERYRFRKLLFATGGRVRRLPFAVDGIIYFRTLDDYLTLRSLADRGKSFAVIGGGFIGSEIAAALALNQKSVTMIFPEDGIGARVYPAALSAFLNNYYQSKGVEVITNTGVADIRKQASRYVVTTTSSRTFEVDGVVAGIGIEPNIELAQAAGLKTENGIVVDEYLRTSHADVYAAGDVASFYSQALGKRLRVEHEDNSTKMGDIAGRNMTGNELAYRHVPFFYSDLFDLGYEAVGELDARMETVADWKEEFREGVVYYLQSGRVRGVLLLNTWGQVDAARDLIAEGGPFNSQNIKGRLPE